jgi:hypothetical protein
MADWKQITARIRRARTGKDPAGQLTNLFSKTRDAMVAFELARYFESKGNTADAGRWYLTAAERFRRADWKTKAQECATRLGATEAAEIPAPAPKTTDADQAAAEVTPEMDSASELESTGTSSTEVEPAVERAAEAERSVEEPAQRAMAPTDANRHRRGRRAGREREQRPPRRGSHGSASRERERPAEQTPSRSVREASPERSAAQKPVESAAEVPLPASARGRFGDPGLASRLTQLEMNFRRLLACPPCALGDAEKAPAGPGVWVLTDSDLSTYYYVEPCQTLRVAIPHLLRGSSARRGDSIKPRLAEHLGIPETRVAKYLSDHCVVRWLQMDEDASHFAHFLIAVLRPALNE